MLYLLFLECYPPLLLPLLCLLLPGYLCVSRNLHPTSGLAQCETDAFSKLKYASTPSPVTCESLQDVVSQDPAASEQAGVLCRAHDLFCRQLGPMRFLNTLLEALIHNIQSPVPFKKDESVLEVLAITVKLAHYNKLSSSAVTVENSHQGVFCSTPLMNLYEEVLTLACDFNKKSPCVQIQIQALVYPMEGLHLATLRLVHTSTRALLDVEEQAMFRSLKYVISKRTNPNSRPARGSSRGGPRGGKRNRII